MKLKQSEADIQKSIIKYLQTKKYYTIRMNTGMIRTESGSYFRQGKKGMADVLVLTNESVFWNIDSDSIPIKVSRVYWCEVKTAKGIQSPAQKLFQAEVESYGHKYLVVRSIDDCMKEGL
jgi:hypothetical protein